MFQNPRSPRRRKLSPSLNTLEGRTLLSVAAPQGMHKLHAAAEVATMDGHHRTEATSSGASVTVLGTAVAGGYQFVNFDGLNPGANAGAGTDANGIANSGTAVGFTIDNDGNFHNFATNPLRSHKLQILNINGQAMAMAFGIN